MTVQSQHFKRANEQYCAGFFGQAEEICLALLNEAPSDVDSLHLLGQVHAATERTDTGVQLLRVAIEIEGPRSWLCRNLGIVLERRGDFAAAVACYRQALEEAPTDHEIWPLWPPLWRQRIVPSKP